MLIYCQLLSGRGASARRKSASRYPELDDAVSVVSIDQIEVAGQLERLSKSWGSEYSYQPSLTEELDHHSGIVDESFVHKVVLWKTNRYPILADGAIDLINSVDRNRTTIDKAEVEELIECLCGKSKGFRLPMASTLMRFLNPHVYQILDRRVYRVLDSDTYREPTTVAKKVDCYLNYIARLREACQKHDVEFEVADRVFYVLDKTVNANEKLNY